MSAHPKCEYVETLPDPCPTLKRHEEWDDTLDEINRSGMSREEQEFYALNNMEFRDAFAAEDDDQDIDQILAAIHSGDFTEAGTLLNKKLWSHAKWLADNT